MRPENHIGATTQAVSVWQDGLIKDTVHRDAKGTENPIKKPCNDMLENQAEKLSLTGHLPGPCFVGLASANGLLCE